MYKNSALLSIGAALLFSLFFTDVGHPFQIDRRQDVRILITAEMKGTANPSTTQESNTPAGAPLHKNKNASVKGTWQSLLMWARVTSSCMGSAPLCARASAQTSPISSSGLNTQDAQKGRPRQAWLIGLIWFIWFISFIWFIWFLWIIRLVWFKQIYKTHQPNQINETDQTHQTTVFIG